MGQSVSSLSLLQYSCNQEGGRVEARYGQSMSPPLLSRPLLGVSTVGDKEISLPGLSVGFPMLLTFPPHHFILAEAFFLPRGQETEMVCVGMCFRGERTGIGR